MIAKGLFFGYLDSRRCFLSSVRNGFTIALCQIFQSNWHCVLAICNYAKSSPWRSLEKFMTYAAHKFLKQEVLFVCSLHAFE